MEDTFGSRPGLIGPSRIVDDRPNMSLCDRLLIRTHRTISGVDHYAPSASPDVVGIKKKRKRPENEGNEPCRRILANFKSLTVMEETPRRIPIAESERNSMAMILVGGWRPDAKCSC